ncbi:hypothetical protein HPB52_012366 [Rhipicephalus sanguineus]|uniref:Transmembrane protein n=1 Tax=Rhipicephalus sanguineus TaxID=34632 RepID=A0A9D4SUC1_RHISA|nr:hypothetical protein HPB52_012366 [Rhipicephalus sanguineus]
MDADLRAHVNVPVVLINHAGLYVIIAELGVSILGCFCVLTYSFTSYAMLKRNAEEVRQYIAASSDVAKVAVDQKTGAGDQPAAAGGNKIGDALSSTVVIPATTGPVNGSRSLATQHGRAGNRIDVSSARPNSDTFPVLARQRASGKQRPDVVQDGGSNEDTATLTIVEPWLPATVTAANVPVSAIVN